MAKNESKITALDDETSLPEGASNGVDTTAADAAVTATVIGTNHDGSLSGVRKMVTIYPSSEDGGDEAVPVGVNGFMYQIPRGIPCSVPEEVLDILKNAKTTSYKAGANGAPVEKTVRRYAFQEG